MGHEVLLKLRNYCHICGDTNSPLFRFPSKDDERMIKWLQFCNVSSLTHLKEPFLCIDHFEESDIQTTAQITYLKYNAVPTKKISVHKILATKHAKKNAYSSICGPTEPHLDRFPPDIDEDEEWLDLCDLHKNSNEQASRKCDIHFANDSFLRNNHGRLNCKVSEDEDIDSSCSNVLFYDDVSICEIFPEDTESEVSAIDPLSPETFCFKPSALKQMRTILSDLRVSVSSMPDTVKTVSNDGFFNAETADNVVPPKVCQTTPVSSNELAHNSISSERLTTSLSDQPRKRVLRYLGDIDALPLESPTRRRKCLSVIRTQSKSFQNKIRYLQKENRRLKSEVRILKTLLNDILKKNNCS